jgi:hypothetical protein
MLIRNAIGLFNPSLLVKILAIRVIQRPTSNHIVYLDHKGKLIDRVKIPGNNSAHISLRDDTVPENLTMSFS